MGVDDWITPPTNSPKLNDGPDDWIVPGGQDARGATRDTGLLDTAGFIGQQIVDTATHHLPGALAATMEGDQPYAERDWKDTLIERSRKKAAERRQELGKGGTAIPGLQREDISNLGPSLGFSGVSMGSGLAAGVGTGVLATPLTSPAGGAVAGYAAGAAAAGTTAYWQAQNQFVRDLRDSVDDDRQRKGFAPITDAEFTAKAQELQPLIREYGLWEAVPEAASGALGFKIIAAPVKRGIGKLFGNSVATRLATKGAALFGTELATETVTQQGQHNVEVEAGMSDEPARSWQSPADLGTSFKEIAAPTILQTALMGGAVKGGMMVRDRLKRPEEEAQAQPGEIPQGAIPAENVIGADLSPEAASEPLGSPPVSAPPSLTGQPAFPASASEPAGNIAVLDATGTKSPIPAGASPKGDTAPLGEPAGRFTLKKLLDDPRSADEIRADMESTVNWRPTPDWQEIPRLWADSAEEPRFFTAQGEVPLTFKVEGGKTYARIAPAPGTREAPVELATPEAVHLGAERTADPTPAQAEAGNYPKRHLRWNGLDIAIETEAGRERTGIGADGVPWSVTLQHPYGYIKRTLGKDGDHLDVYLGPDPQSARVFVVDQIDPDSLKFDEHKLIVGARDDAEAMAIYSSGFSDGSAPHRWGGVTIMSPAELKAWLAKGDTKKALVYKPPRQQSRPKGPYSLFQFLASIGGIKDLGGELRVMDLQRAFVPGFGRLVRPNGKPLDAAREAAVEAGYLRDTPWEDGVSVSTINDLLTLLDREARGQKVYAEQDVAAALDLDGKKAARQAADQVKTVSDEIRALTTAEGINATDEEVRRAAERVLVNGADPIDAIVEVVEESYYATLDELILLEPQEGLGHADDGGRTDAGRAGIAPPRQQPAGPQAGPAAERAPGGEQPGQAQQPGPQAEALDGEIIPPGQSQNALQDEVRETMAAAYMDAMPGQSIIDVAIEGVEDEIKAGSATSPEGVPWTDVLAELKRRRGKGPDVTINSGGDIVPQTKPKQIEARETGPSDSQRREIGKNAAGRTLFEDARGVRFYVEKGIRITEPVTLDRRGGISIENRRDEFNTVAELAPTDAASSSTPIQTGVSPQPAIALAQSLPDSVVKPSEPLPEPIILLAHAVMTRLQVDRKPITSKFLQDEASRWFGGTLAEGKFDRKDMFDALELGVNMLIRSDARLRVDDGKPGTISRLRELLGGLPTQRVRSEEMESFQQFSTPPHYAAAAAYAANLRAGDVMLEPSAGTGSLVAAASAPDVTIIANELSERRAAMLRELIGDNGRVFTENAEQIDNILPDDVKPTVVLMNPPFSATAGRMGDKKVHETASVHIEEALNRLEPGGRLVAIAGQGMVMGHPRFRAWWAKIGKQHTIRANIGVSGKVYEKYGTTFGTRLIVIDKVAASAGHKPVLADAQTVDDLMRILEPIRNGRQRPEGAQAQSGVVEPSGAPLGRGNRRAGELAPSASAGPGQSGPGGERGGRVAGARDGGAARAGESAVRVGTGKSDGVAPDQPERSGPSRAGSEPVAGDRGRGQRGARRGAGAQRDLEQASGGQPGPATRGERVELERSEPGEQSAGEISESLYQTYEPQRVRTKGAKPHPGPLVESASMSSVNPPAPTYTPHLPKSVIEKGLLSQAQLEPIVYAGQAHAEMLPAADEEPVRRKGYFIGDGTGVGKGREVAGIILDNWQQGRTKAVWVSEKQTLIQDAKRDWTGLGQNGNLIFNAGKVKAGEKIQAAKGIGFITYDTLKGGMSDQAAIARGQFVRKQKVAVNGQAGVIAKIEQNGRDKPADITIDLDNKSRVTVPANEVTATESVAVKSRVDQLVEWLGQDFDGVIAFDEAHNMGNAAPSKTERGLKEAAQKALAGIELQKRLPNARVVYVSATGATEVSNLAFADRLGLWGRGTPFESRAKFVAEIEKGGIAAMELIARDMKQLGLYTARNLSYDGVEYDRIEHKLDANQREIYDTLADAWQGVLRNINAALEETGGEKDGRAKAAAYSAFWGAHQRFFNQIVTAMQMPSVIKAVEKDLAEGRQAVLQLTNTNEASQERAAAKATTAEEIEDLDITPRDQIIQLVEKSFPTQEYERYRDEEGKERSRPVTDSAGNPVQNKQALRMKEALIERLASVRVPQGPLDMVLDHFGVDVVAEVTGRGRRFVLKPDEKTGDRRRVEDSRPGSANLAETDAFQSGKKKVLIFSEAGGTGRSYHAENTAPSKNARRAHYLVQGGWRADKAVQGFGRTHRTNQASAPIVKLVTTDLQGQKRFISSIARRLGQLGALTKGQRQAGDQGIFSARDNLESKEANHALQQFFNDLLRDNVPGIRIDEFEEQTGLKLRIQDEEGRVTGAKQEFPPITQFLNRLLSLKIDMQNKVFDAFSERLDRVIEARRQAGLLDVGLETIRADKIAKDSEKVVHTIPGTDAETKYVKLTLSNKFVPLDFKEAAESIKRPVKFFARSPKGKVYAVAEAASLTNDKGVIVDYYRLTNPVSGSHHIERKNVDAGKDWSKIDRGEAKKLWEAETAKAPEFLTESLHLVTGAILPIWDRLQGNPRVVRLQTDAGERFIGRVVPSGVLAATLKNLGAEAEAPKVTPEGLFKTLMDGGRARLTNGWTLKRSRVANENRIELVGPATFSEGTEVKQDGVFTERIEYKVRYFVPIGETEGPEVLGKLLKFRQVVDVTEAHQRPDTAAAGDEPMFALRRDKDGAPTGAVSDSGTQLKAVTLEHPAFEVRTPFTAKFLEHSEAIYQLLRSELDRIGLRKVGLMLADRIELWRDGKLSTADAIYAERTITIALNTTNKFNLLHHEALHGLRRLDLFKDTEWAILARASNARWRTQFEIEKYYRDWPEWIKVEEGVAHAYAAWADGTLKVDGRIARLFKRIRDFFEVVGNVLRGEGLKTAEDIFRDIKGGKLSARDPETGQFSRDGQISFAVRSGDGDLFKTEIVQTPDGPKEQFVIPGAEKAGDKERGDRGAARPLKPGKAQKGTDGLPLFDDKDGELPLFAVTRDTESEAFKRWFGESKVVDEDGSPRVVYHGTTKDFDSFEAKANRPEIGFHFGTAKQAEVFADKNGGRVIPVYLRIKNPLRMRDAFGRGGIAFSRIAQELSRLGLISSDKYFNLAQVRPLREAVAVAQRIIEGAGHDGIVYENAFEGLRQLRPDEAIELKTELNVLGGEGKYVARSPSGGAVGVGPTPAAARADGLRWLREGDHLPSDSYIVFHPEQIKSATSNRGTFDPNSPDIRFALRREPGTAMERQRVMQGFIARGQPLDRAIRVPFDIFGGTTHDGRWKPGVALWTKDSSALTGALAGAGMGAAVGGPVGAVAGAVVGGAAGKLLNAKFTTEGRFTFLNPILEAARTGLVDRYGLDPKYVTRNRERALDERAVMLQGAEALKSLKDHNVGPAEAKVLQAILTGEDVTDAQMAKLADPIRAAVDQLGQEAVALGLVSAESFERNRGTYLHRVYQKYEAEQHGLTRMVNSIMGSSRKKIIGDQFRGRGLFQEVDVGRLMRDIPDWHEGARGKPQKGEMFVVLDEMPQQAQLALDEKETSEKPLRRVYWPADKEIPDRYDTFHNQGVWEVRGEKNGKLVLWRDFTKDERVKMGEILDARYTIGKTFMLMAHDLAVGKFYKDIAENEAWTRNTTPNAKWLDAAEWSAQRQRAWKHGDIEWVRVPETEIPNSGGKKRWGGLAGRWVREEIWRDLNEIDLMSRPGMWRSLLTQWKLNKTARSPVVHMNNVMSNFVLMDMIDVRWQDFAAGLRSYIAKDAHYEEAFQHGAFGADMMTQEIRDQVLRPILEEISRDNTFQQGGRLGMLGQMTRFTELLWSKLKALDQKMIDGYRVEDEIFRMATYMRRRDLGDDPKQAAEVAREQFIDYDIRAPWVNMARNTVLPFISYTYRAAPLVAKAIATRPWKLTKYFLLAYAANAMAYALTGGDEDRERRSLRDQEQGFTWIGAYRMIRMPWNDRHGNPIFLDIRRWIPAGDIFDMSNGDIPAWLNIGGPLMIAAELFLNRSAFTGQEIVNTKTDDWWDRAQKRGDHLYKSWMPSAAYVPGSWYWEKIGNAAKGATDSQGRPYSIGLALSSSVGVKLKPQDVQDAMSWKAYEFRQVERALETEARRLGRRKERNLISEAEFNRAMQRIITKKKNLAEKARKTLQ